MDINAALRAFVRTVEKGSVSGAARDLAVSQPAVTKHLRNLEAHVNARLLGSPLPQDQQRASHNQLPAGGTRCRTGSDSPGFE